MTQPGIELRSLGPLANTLPTRPMSQWTLRLYEGELFIEEVKAFVRAAPFWAATLPRLESLVCPTIDP